MFTNSSIMGYDATFSMNEFNNPKLLSEIEMIVKIIIFVLFTKPGQYPSLPMIGLDIQNVLYSFYDELDPVDLKNKLVEQCGILGAYFTNGIINIRKYIYKNQPSLLISVSGTPRYPVGYMKTIDRGKSGYLIGITLNELKEIVYDIDIIK